MFDQMGSFDQAFARGPDGPAAPLRLRKTSEQRAFFWGANLVVMPLVALVYLTVSAEGLRAMMPVFATPLWKAVPGGELMRGYAGWSRLDLAMAAALLLFLAVSALLARLFEVLMNGADLEEARAKKPVLFYALAAVAAVVLLGDSAIFYLGLQSKAASGWTETPGYVPALATLMYLSGLALVAAWHADYRTSGAV